MGSCIIPQCGLLVGLSNAEERNMDNRYFILDENHRPVPASHEEWSCWFEDADRTVSHDTVSWDVYVSTVFLGINHRFGDDGPPLLFETMIFGGEHDGWQARYSTWDEAVEGHKR